MEKRLTTPLAASTAPTRKAASCTSTRYRSSAGNRHPT